MAKKTNLGRMLFAEKKKMVSVTLDKWEKWIAKEQPTMTDTTRYNLMIGKFISRNNVQFAYEALAKARELNGQYEKAIEKARLALKNN